MATESKIIIIDVQFKDSLNRIAELSQAIEELSKKEQKAGETAVQYKNRMADQTVTIKMHRQEIALLSKEVANKWKVDQQELGHIEKLKAEVANLTLTYERLNKEQLEGSKGTQVLNDLKSKREELAKLNQAYGNYGLNVGNYSSATKMLGINIGQVMKEMPNFAISARIGIMSLTNNLPMLAETIKQVRVEQLAMIAAGQKAPSMFSLISKSIFGLTGFMSIAMVLMQIFGDDIIKWVGSLFKGKEAVDELSKSLLELNKITSENLGNNLQKAKLFAIDFNKAVRDGNVERIKDLTEIGKKEYNLNQERLDMIAQNVNSWKAAFKDYLQIAKETYFNEALAKKQTETRINAEIQAEKMKSIKAELDPLETRRDTGQGVSVKEAFRINSLRKQYHEEAKLLEEANNQTLALNKIAYKNVYNLEQEEEKKSVKSKKEIKKEKLKIEKDYYLELDLLAEDLYRKYFEKRAKEIEENLKLQKEAFEIGYKMLEKTLSEEEKLNEEYYKNVNDYLKINEQAQIESNISDYAFEQAKLDAEYAQRIAAAEKVEGDTTAIKEAYKVKSELLANQEFERKKAITFEYANVTKDTLGNLNSFVGALADRELQEWAKTNKGKANYDEEYAKNKADLEYKAAVRGKAMSIFGTIITTASSVMAAVAAPPVGLGAAGVPLAILNGINGAAQIATILATPIPTSESAGSSGNKSTSQVTEKFHTGTYRPSSANEEQEITRTLLTTERVLSPTQTTIFDSMIGRMQSYGGSNSITSGVGTNDYLQENMLVRAFSVALKNQKPQQISWSEFSNQAQRQQQLENNLFVR